MKVYKPIDITERYKLFCGCKHIINGCCDAVQITEENIDAVATLLTQSGGSLSDRFAGCAVSCDEVGGNPRLEIEQLVPSSKQSFITKVYVTDYLIISSIHKYFLRKKKDDFETYFKPDMEGVQPRC